jgi:hypothetical protein
MTTFLLSCGSERGLATFLLSLRARPAIHRAAALPLIDPRPGCRAGARHDDYLSRNIPGRGDSPSVPPPAPCRRICRFAAGPQVPVAM